MGMFRLLAVLAGLILLFISLSGTPASAQARQAPAKPLQYDVSVTLKLIQVYVTDKDGKPVKDLARDDFILIDNGRPVTITEFEKHDLAAAPKGAVSPAPEINPAPAPAASPILSRKFVILFDLAFNTARGVVASVEAARHFLDQEVRPEDEVAFMSYSMLRGLRIHEFLTTDHDKVKAALAAITSKDIAGRADEIEQAYWMKADTSGEQKEISREEAAQIASMDMQRRDSAQQGEKYFRDLTRLAQALRLVQGQKSVLFFSTGVPSSLINMSRSVGTDKKIGNTGTPQWMSTGTVWQVGDSVLSPLQEKMLKEFSASNCSFYAFDTRESSKLPALFTYDEMAFLNRPAGGLLGADSGGVFRDDKTTGMDTLRRLSKQTGGKYYSNIALHEKSLEEVSAVTGTYYVLGYPIPTVADGQFHDLKIDVKRKGCRVRTQPGYFNPKLFREYTDIEKNIHLFALALNGRSEFQTPKMLQISALSYDPGQGSRVRALVRIPEEIWGQFTGQTAEIVALFFDAQDALMSLQRVAVPLAEYRGKEVLFSAAVSARPGPTKCRIVVRDLDTGQSAVASISAHSGPSGGQTLSVFSPLLVVEGSGPFLLEGVVKGAPETPSWRGIYGYDAAVYSPVIGDGPVGARKIGVILPYTAPGLGPADLIYKANLVNSTTGESLAVPLELQESKTHDTIEVQKLAISLDNVPSGKFLLYIHVGNKTTGHVSSVSAPVTVRR
jgi:VWFA-related protein